MTFYNIARMYTETTGDSDVTLTTAVPGCKSFADVGVVDSEELHYGLITYDLASHRPTGSEVGIGKYIASGTVFKRTTVEKSTDSDDSQINLTGLTEIYLCPIASDFNAAFSPNDSDIEFSDITTNNSSTAKHGFLPKLSGDSTTYLNGDGEWIVPSGGGSPSFASYYQLDDSTASDSDDGLVLNIQNEWIDPDGIASVSGGVISINQTGWYMVSGTVRISSSGALNGYVSIYTSQSTDPKPRYPITTSGAVSNIAFPIILWLFPVNSAPLSLDVRLDNHTGATITAAVYEVTIVRRGNV